MSGECLDPGLRKNRLYSGRVETPVNKPDLIYFAMIFVNLAFRTVLNIFIPEISVLDKADWFTEYFGMYMNAPAPQKE